MRVVVLICAAVDFGSVSRPGSGFGEVRAISTLQLWRLSCPSDRDKGTGAERGGSGCCCERCVRC